MGNDFEIEIAVRRISGQNACISVLITDTHNFAVFEHIRTFRKAAVFCHFQQGTFRRPPALFYARENAAALAADHCVENCRQRLKQGRKILEDAFGFEVTGFRAPALQESPGMFEALALENYTYDSSNCMQETGWDYLLDKLDVPPRELDRERWEKITSVVPGKEFPGGCDYTWFLPQERYDITMKLAKHDFDACLALDVPFITVSHVDPVFNGEGIRFLKELFQYAKEKAKAEGKELVFANLETIAAQYNVR
jgi:hypothetical protein